MLITKAEVNAARRNLLARPRDQRRPDEVDFKVRPISEEWRLMHRKPGFRTATCNVAYIWRDSEVADRFGPMPRSFEERRCELRGAGLLLPAKAPLWTTETYRIWQEADAAAANAGDPTAIRAWHLMAEIPHGVSPSYWQWMFTGFLQHELVARGAAVAWAIHALQGADGEWLVAPHGHAIVTARHFLADARKGQRHPAWIATWAQQWRLEAAWRRRCSTVKVAGDAGPF